MSGASTGAAARTGGPRYEIAYRNSDGRQRRQVVEGGLKAARAALADAKARMGKGQRVAPAPGLTFGEAAERWQLSQTATGRSSRSRRHRRAPRRDARLVLALTRSRRGTASITHQLDRRGAYVELKTARSRRTVELPASLVALLRAHKLASSHTRDDDYVFASASGGGLDHRNVGGRALARAVKAAAIETPDGQAAPTFHALRHGFASAWIAAGGIEAAGSGRRQQGQSGRAEATDDA